ncbi:MAG: hypothetical protein HEEMFOPI_01388 [Holosporales bacterium]
MSFLTSFISGLGALSWGDSTEEVPSLACFHVEQEKYIKELVDNRNFLSKINNEIIEKLFFYLKNLQSKKLLGERASTAQEIENHLALEAGTLKKFTEEKECTLAEKILSAMARYYQKNSGYERALYLSQLKRDNNFGLKIRILIDLSKNYFFEVTIQVVVLKTG